MLFAKEIGIHRIFTTLPRPEQGKFLLHVLISKHAQEKAVYSYETLQTCVNESILFKLSLILYN